MLSSNPYVRFGHHHEDKVYIDVSPEERQQHYRGIDLYRIKQFRSGLCNCPRKKRLECDIDCHNCPYYTNNRQLSLDNLVDADQEASYADLISDPIGDFEETYSKNQITRFVSKIVASLSAEEQLICHIYMYGLTRAECARQLGITRDQLRTRERKLVEQLRVKLAPFIFCK